jgi:hypothetical protein
VTAEISHSFARKLIDYSGGIAGQEHAWEEQLRGAVAVHNVVAREGVCYLADEVGMGKTYVALGAIALMRLIKPDLRVLYVVPNENLQDKWQKEIRNFTANDWLWKDNRVRSLNGRPAYGVEACTNLIDFAHKVIQNPNRDFLLRMTSFSLPLALQNPEQWLGLRDRLLECLPWVDTSLFDLRDKDQFKANFARAVNEVIPRFDLVLIDEAHNLKHGLREDVAARNRLLAYVLGHPEGRADGFGGYGPRFDKLILLSATPFETDYSELWNQLALFDRGKHYDLLGKGDVDEKVRREVAGRFLIRRLTTLKIGQEEFTKNMYRLEWRHGGVQTYDLPLEVPDERSRLIVALVQKKVAELLGTTRFNRTFQIGMLSSFESFFETAKVVSSGEEPVIFDGSEQTEDQAQKEGIDTPSLNSLALSYRAKFGSPMPHPKMEEIVANLGSSFQRDEKTLVFVRRIKSVKELKQKLDERYDQWLMEYLRDQLSMSLQDDLERAFDRYEQDHVAQESTSWRGGDTDIEENRSDTFFAWFFRGEGPLGFFSGASLNSNRFQSEGSAYSTFFEDNYITGLLGECADPVAEIARLCGMSEGEVTEKLRHNAYAFVRQSSRQRKIPRLRIFREFQHSALCFLAEGALDSELKEKAKTIWLERFGSGLPRPAQVSPRFPQPKRYLKEVTFFSELRKHNDLREDIWPREQGPDFRLAFRRQEQRRELVSAVARLGRPLIDLWILAAKRTGSILERAQERTEERSAGLIVDFIHLLEVERGTGRVSESAYRELAEVGKNFDLLLAVNFHEAREKPLGELARMFGSALGNQSPVAGMSGKANPQVVGQFRMPGYPLILVTTDVLQQGEDLHTFCRRVIHYGITWTPSGMEQRTGRVDRIHSLTQRTLDGRPQATQEQKLQVYYPYLRETVERLQVERVFERMNRFLRMLHATVPQDSGFEKTIDVARAIVAPAQDVSPVRGKLETLFDVKPEWLEGVDNSAKLKSMCDLEPIHDHFQKTLDSMGAEFPNVNKLKGTDTEFVGVVDLSRSLSDGEANIGGDEQNLQPFFLELMSSGDGKTLIRAVSPIGELHEEDEDLLWAANDECRKVSCGALVVQREAKLRSLMLSIRSDMVVERSPASLRAALSMIRECVEGAHSIEKRFFSGQDETQLEKFAQEEADEELD